VGLEARPAEGYEFTHWSGDATGTNRATEVQMAGSRRVVANFRTVAPVVYRLETGASPEAGGWVDRSPNKTNYNAGEGVRLTARAAEGFRLTHWSGDAAGGAASVDVVMNANRSATAHFARNSYPLGIDVSPAGAGIVLKAPGNPSYEHGEIVSLTALNNQGYTFSHWSGDASGDEAWTAVAMDEARNITANFKQNFITLQTQVIGEGSIQRQPAQAGYSSGEQVTLTAVAAPGFRFSHWSDGVGGPTRILTLTEDTSVAAVFVTDFVIGLYGDEAYISHYKGTSPHVVIPRGSAIMKCVA
jgi:hypothetical protein